MNWTDFATLPPEWPRSPYHLLVNGKTVPVSKIDAGHLALVPVSAPPYSFELIHTEPFQSASIHPQRLGSLATISDGCVNFSLKSATAALVKLDGAENFFIGFLHASSCPEGKKVLRFPAGRIHEIGELWLEPGTDVVWIEPGAVVRGVLRGSHLDGLTIGGGGILDGSAFHYKTSRRPSLLLHHCRNVVIENISLVNPSAWMLVLGACENVRVSRCQILGDCVSSDGIDVCGCQHVTVEDCFLRNGDDNLVIKSITGRQWLTGQMSPHVDWRRNVDDILFQRCSTWNHRGGAAFEIGYELSAESIRNVLYKDCDVLGVHNYGSVFGIHNADRALVENIVYENIHVEHHFDNLVDFRVIDSRWSEDKQRGNIRNVRLENIAVHLMDYNVGYSVSLMGGWSPKQPVSGVSIKNMKIADKLVQNQDDMHLYIKNVEGLSFE